MSYLIGVGVIVLVTVMFILVEINLEKRDAIRRDERRNELQRKVQNELEDYKRRRGVE